MVIYSNKSLKNIFILIIYLGLFFSNFFPIFCTSIYYTDEFNITNHSQNNKPTIISSNFTVIADGNYTLIARSELNVIYVSVSQEFGYGVPSLELIISYSMDVTFSAFFSMVFPGSAGINNSELVIAAVPITINSSEFNNWTVSASIVSNRYQDDSVAFYYITSRDFIQLDTVSSEVFEEFTFSGKFQGNGTYVFLGKIKEPRPFWLSPYFYVGMGLFAIQLFVIALIGKFVVDFISGKSGE